MELPNNFHNNMCYILSKQICKDGHLFDKETDSEHNRIHENFFHIQHIYSTIK